MHNKEENLRGRTERVSKMPVKIKKLIFMVPNEFRLKFLAE
jgi:hypothetical protein